MRFLDWTDISTVGADYGNLDVSLSGLSRCILIAALRTLATRHIWTEGDTDISDSAWDDTEAALAQAMLEVNTAMTPASLSDSVVEFCQLTSGTTGGGSSSATTWMTRPLTDHSVLPTWCTHDGNVVTVTPGWYLLRSIQTCYSTGHTRPGFYIHFGMATTTIEGCWAYARTTEAHEILLPQEYLLAAADTCEITVKMYTQLAQASNGLGVGVASPNRFATFHIFRLGD